MVFPEVEMVAPALVVGTPLADSNFTWRHRVTIVRHKPASAGCTHADWDTVLSPSDPVIVAATRHHLEAFALEVG
ncbi:MAG: TrkA C-terminal domain-containing protein [Ilumatobacter sp.]|nr:TrkA C-terminal domain-containing protein [Ilumatobacter sp.]